MQAKSRRCKHPQSAAALAAAFVAFVHFGAASQGAIITLQEGLDGYAGTNDTSLVQDGSANNFGGRNEILTGVLGAGRARDGLVRFDVSGLSGQYTTVNSMNLKLKLFTTQSGTQSLGMRLVPSANAGWVEGTENGTPQIGSASWSHMVYNTVGWPSGVEAGTSIMTTPVNIASGTAAGTEFTFNIDTGPTLTSILNQWVTPTTNGGILLIRSSGTAQPRFSSSEFATASDRPILTISATGTINWNVVGSGNWDTSSSNWTMGTSVPSVIYENADTVNFTNTAGGVIAVQAGGVLPAAVNFSAASGTYEFTGGVIGGTGDLTKSAAGTLIVSNDNVYSGATNVNGGTLVLNGTHTPGGGAGDYTIANNASLLGTGATNGNLLVQNGGTVGPGATPASIESLGVGDITFTTGGIFAFDLNSDSSTADLLYGDAMALNNATLALSDLGSSLVPVGNKLTLIAYDEPWDLGIFDGYLDDSLFTFAGNQWLINYNDNSPGSNFASEAEANGNLFVTLTAVPEPSTWKLAVLGMLAMAAYAWQRREVRALSPCKR